MAIQNEMTDINHLLQFVFFVPLCLSGKVLISSQRPKSHILIKNIQNNPLTEYYLKAGASFFLHLYRNFFDERKHPHSRYGYR